MVRKTCFLCLTFSCSILLAMSQAVSIFTVSFEGNSSLDAVKLKAQLRGTREGGLYNPQLLELELQNIEKFCRDEGFLNAKVGPPIVDVHSVPGKGQGAAIRIPVSEGFLYKLGKLNIIGATEFRAATLLQMAPLREGQPYSRRELGDWREKILESYQTMGHIRFNSILKEDVQEMRKVVDCTLELQEGKAYRVGKITIEGDGSINPAEFKRQLLVSEGGLYNPEMFNASFYFINSLGKYRPIKPSDLGTSIDDTRGTIDLVIRVTPVKKTSEIEKKPSANAGSLAPLRFVPASFQEPAPTIRTEVALVNVVFNAVDRNNRFVSGLKVDDFLVFEDKQPQKVEYFSDLSKANDIPLTIALLIDTSGSVKNKLSYEKETAAEFFRNVLRRNKDLALIIQFDSDVNLVQDFTENPERLIQALDTLEAGNSTSLYDAIFLAVDEKLKTETGRKVIVVITDGEDTSSKLRKEVAIESAQKNDVLIYGIGVRGDFGTNFGVLKKFAEETGGLFFSPRAKFSEVQAAFRAIGEDLQGQYSLAYISSNTNRDGSFRNIEIRSKTSGVRVRARKGYYAPKATATASR